MYEYIDTATETTKFLPNVVCDNDNSEEEEDVYNEELLRLHRSGLHLIIARPVTLQITNVL